MAPLHPAELRQPWRLLGTRRPWAALLYLAAQVLGGLMTVTCFAVVALIPVWLLVWPRLEPRLLPLAGHPVPVVRRSSRFELRWRDWALVLLTPVAGFAGLVVFGLGVVLPVVLLTSPLVVAATGAPVRVLAWTVGTPAEQVAAVAAGALLLLPALWLAVVVAHGWGRLTSGLLGDEEGRLAAQVDALSEQNARAADQLALERRQLQRDLHDGAQMHLGSAGMRLALLHLDLENLPDDDTRRALLSSLGGVREQLDAAAHAVRDTARGLVPATLRDGGLCPALREAADALPLPTRVDCELPRLDPATETGLFFIATEALANAVRHAGAGTVDLRAGLDSGRVLLRIGDDGRGGARPTGTGLLGIQARARLLGGEAVIDSPPGRGTRIVVRVPHEPRPAPSAAARVTEPAP